MQSHFMQLRFIFFVHAHIFSPVPANNSKSDPASFLFIVKADRIRFTIPFSVPKITNTAEKRIVVFVFLNRSRSRMTKNNR